MGAINQHFRIMTEQEIKSAEFIGSVILPKLQEIQRNIFFSEYITMDIEQSTYKRCVNVYLRISTNFDGLSDRLCDKLFSFSTYLCNEEKQKEANLKALRGIQYFIANWQKLLA